jgi:ethanolamine ammonia-lyase small subunit
MMGLADLAINGSYLAYVYVVLLEISILYLQRPDLNRRLCEKNQKPSASPDFYSVATGFIGTGLNWLSWLLSAYVAKEFGIANGVLFFILGMGSSMIANGFIPRLPRVDQVGHIISIPATILLVRAVLLSVGIQTGI